MASVGKTTIAASGTTTFSPSTHNTLKGLQTSTYHTISITGSGTATIEFKHMDQDNFVSVATGVSGDFDTYECRYVSEIKITETGGANSIDVAINSYEE